MEAHTFFLYLLIILLSARLFAEIAVRLKSPSVIGELFAGIVIGPSLFGWIEPVEALKLMAEIGVILLLFEVGLGTDIKRLVRSGTKSILVAIIGFIAPLLLG
ncbi:MAG: cation:proton antiporter, partial [Gammaproteobacteria bacterium]|nr:cation:proton antiporter [Gammaproteobacteria bacterium]